MLQTATLAACSVPIAGISPNLTSFTKQLKNTHSISSRRVVLQDIEGVTRSTFEIGPKGRRIGHHVETFFLASVNINRSGNPFCP